MTTIDFRNLDTTTSDGRTFTGEQYAAMAALIYRRWGCDAEAACAAWRRLFQNGTTIGAFRLLVDAGLDAVNAGAKNEPTRFVRGICVPYRLLERLKDGEEHVIDGASWLKCGDTGDFKVSPWASHGDYDKDCFWIPFAEVYSQED